MIANFLPAAEMASVLPELTIYNNPQPLRFKALGDCQAIKPGEPGYDTAPVEIQAGLNKKTGDLFTVWCKTPFAMDAGKPRIVTEPLRGEIIWTNKS